MRFWLGPEGGPYYSRKRTSQVGRGVRGEAQKEGCAGHLLMMVVCFHMSFFFLSQDLFLSLCVSVCVYVCSCMHTQMASSAHEHIQEDIRAPFPSLPYSLDTRSLAELGAHHFLRVASQQASAILLSLIPNPTKCLTPQSPSLR